MKKVSILANKMICFLLIAVFLAGAAMSVPVYAAEERAVISNCSEYVTLRKSNSTSSAKVIRIPLGMEVSVVGHTSNGFAKVQYSNCTGYVLEEYLKPWKKTQYSPKTKSKSGNLVYCGNHGTAKRIEGRTVLVAIYANDKTTSWNFNKQADINQRLRNRFNMNIAQTWLTEQTKRWKSNPGGFVWDWRSNGDLYYEHTFSEDIIKTGGYSAIKEFIHKNIPIQDLLTKYEADNIIFCVYLNAPNSNKYRSWSYPCLYNEVAANQYEPEMCVFVPYGRGKENTPAVFAHEMLHCFGAYDLYETDSSSPITQKYVNYLMSHHPNDLMNQCYFSDYDLITNKFSDVDAYYTGLISTCSDVKNWGLGKSTFDKYKEN